MSYSYDRTKTAAMSLDVAEKTVGDLRKEIKVSLDRLQVLRGHFERGRRAAPNDYWDELDGALKKAEGPLTVAFRALQGL
jgi:hypothetical protein